MNITRRDLLSGLTMAGAACALGAPRLVTAGSPADHAHDWDWLTGNWDVHHDRLRDRLVGSTTWDSFEGKSAFWHTLGGLGNVDDDLLYLPTGTYRAFSARTFDPATNQWAIWWLDSRTAGRLDPPVRGGFVKDEGEFFGSDVHKGTPVTVRFRWHETRGKRPWWDQSFSTDERKTWEINWRNYFTRTSAVATPIPLDGPADPAAADWQFLVGRWRVRNRRRRADGKWEEFASELNNWPVMGGLGNVSDNVFHAPGGTYRGMSLRAYDAGAKVWRSWWVDSRAPADFGAPLVGGFGKGAGTLTGDGARSSWTRTDTSTPHWEQAVSTNGGAWETNWSADFERVG
ncbi:MAG TPA: twin-arginine translocation signal domain-containing protein [Steroidobacteraceae bacterium]|nr:twin-arginine translocation signal domain-containing protein [Steroidobacteraceae bacterium]